MKRIRLKRTRTSNHREQNIDKSTQEQEQCQTRSDTEESVQLPRKKVRWESNSESMTVADAEDCSSEDDTSTSKVKYSKDVRVLWS